MVVYARVLLLRVAQKLTIKQTDGLVFCGSTVGAYAFSFFLPIILGGGGFSTKLSLILSAPPYILAFIWVMTVSSEQWIPSPHCTDLMPRLTTGRHHCRQVPQARPRHHSERLNLPRRTHPDGMGKEDLDPLPRLLLGALRLPGQRPYRRW